MKTRILKIELHNSSIIRLKGLQTNFSLINAFLKKVRIQLYILDCIHFLKGLESIHQIYG